MTRHPHYRLYIDESGNDDLPSASDERHRYLNLTGIIIALDHVKFYLAPALDQLKTEIFHQHPDAPIILHRKEILNAQGQFLSLRDKALRQKFDTALFDILLNADYRVISVTMDKAEMMERYQAWRADPYHYALEIMLERYVWFLKQNNALGDVMCESRGGKTDMRLKQEYKRLYEEGTAFMPSSLLQAWLSSMELKIKPKTANIAGLQIADCLTNPAMHWSKCTIKRERFPDNFGGKLMQILEKQKFFRSRAGKIVGYGAKWLP